MWQLVYHSAINRRTPCGHHHALYGHLQYIQYVLGCRYLLLPVYGANQSWNNP